MSEAEWVRCVRCERDLPRAAFPKAATRPNGLYAYCRECNSEAGRRAWRERVKIRVCRHCGAEFEFKHANSVYCGPKCGNLADYYRNRERRMAIARAWKARSRDRIREYVRRVRESDPEKFRERERRRDKDRKRAKNRRYYARHREEFNARIRAYHRANPQIPANAQARRRARKHGAGVNDLTAAQWHAIKEAFGFRCAYCGAKPDELTRDHIVPLARGGGHTMGNIVPACRRCNCSKGTKPPAVPVQPVLL